MPEAVPYHKIRLLQILPRLDSGGVERGTVDLACALRKDGHFSLVISHGGRLVDVLRDHDVLHIKMPVHTKNPLAIIRHGFQLARIIGDYDINVIHARSRAPAWSALLAARLTKIPLITTFHGTYNFSQGLSGRLKKFYNSIMVRGDRVIAISGFIKDHILKNYTSFLTSPDVSSIVQIDRAVDLKAFSRKSVSLTRPQKLREKWQILPGQKVLLVPARFTRWKGQLVVLKALVSIVKKEPSVVAVFLGSDQGRLAYMKEMETFVRESHLEKHVRFVDHEEDMPGAFAAATMMVHASTDPEAFGRVITEAQAMEVPVVASNLGEPGRMIVEGVTGFLHQAGNSDHLAEQILHVLGTDTSDVIMNALSHVKTHYDQHVFVEKNLAVYQDVMTHYGRAEIHREPKTILVIRHGAFGDIVKSTGVFKALRANHPHAHITLLTAPDFVEFVKSLEFFDQVMVDERRQSLTGYWQITTQIHQGAFDVIYDLQGTNRTERYYHLLCWRYGRSSFRWSGKAKGCHYPHDESRLIPMHPYDRLADQLYNAGLLLQGQRHLQPDVSHLHPTCALDVPTSFGLLIPGSSAATVEKRWPPLFYGEIASKLWDKGVVPVIIGSTLEKPLVEMILKKCPQVLDLTGKTSYLDILALARQAQCVIGNDTGPMYMASLAGKPTFIPWSNYCHESLTAPRGDHIHVIHEPLLVNLLPSRLWTVIQKSVFAHG